MSNVIEGKALDQERALYGSRDVIVRDCRFDGPADGESALKECRDVTVEHCYLNLRYPMWHVRDLSLRDSELTVKCRAALWYCDRVRVEGSRLHGIKALRECSRVSLAGCDIVSPEFGWSVRGCTMEDCSAEGEYFMMRSSDVRLSRKYSFQYVGGLVIEDSELDTKDAFWHARDVVVRNSLVKGEYLGWYSENVTFENCRIVGTQPLCYCRGLRLVNCEMVGCDLAFERSVVSADITTPVESVKNPLEGSRIELPSVGEVIRDIDGATGSVIVRESEALRPGCRA